MLIYGINPVLEALRAGRVKELRVSERAGGRVRIDAIKSAERDGHRGPSRDAGELDRDARGGVHQGIAADVADRRSLRCRAISCSGARGAPLIVVLDGIEDPHNVGAILRTADAAGADGVDPAVAPCGAARRGGRQGVRRRGLARQDRGGREHRAGARGAERSRRLDGRAGRAIPAKRLDQIDLTVPTASGARRRGEWPAAPGPGALRLAGVDSDAGSRSKPERVGRRRDRALRSGSPAQPFGQPATADGQPLTSRTGIGCVAQDVL